MTALRARVTAGRLVLDVPTSLPEGTEVDLVVAGDGDELDDAERARLHEALDGSLAQVRADKTVPMGQVLDGLRRRSGRAT